MMELISLANKDQSSLIADVVIHPLRVNRDETGGILVETLRTDWDDVYGSQRPFAMQYFSITDSMVARDENVWHYHPTGQEDRFLVCSGAIVVAIADQREASITKGLLNLFHMQAANSPYLLVVPRQTLHGFLVVSKEQATLLNFPTRLYDQKEEGRVPHDQASVKFSDGTLFDWDKVRSAFT